MKKNIFVVLVLIVTTWQLNAAEGVDLQQKRKEVVIALKEALLMHYVLPEQAELVASSLEKLSTQPILASYSDDKKFAKFLQEYAQEVLKDDHFRVLPPRVRPNIQDVDILEQHYEALTNFRKGGFQEIKMFEGNVGYVKINGFRREDMHQVDGLMTYLRTADAIIIDLTENRGGAQPVNYLRSYFLPESLLVGKTYNRYENHWQEHRVETIKGERRLDVPLFILTSPLTFSAAEDFAYNLQAHKRATIIGEVTGGGAHPAKFVELSNGMASLIPNRRSYNPVTRTNWQGTGVVPNVKVEKSKLLSEAKSLAKQAAMNYRQESFDKMSDIIAELEDLTSSQLTEATHRLEGVVETLLYRRHIEPFMINGFARRFKQQGKAKAAEVLSVIAEKVNNGS